MLAVGKGVTVIVKDTGTPGQPLAVGVTVIVAVTGVDPVFVAIKDEMFPEPFAARPMEVLLFVQLNMVPLTAPEKFIAFVEEP